MKTNRIVALLAVLCLITTCFVGTTLAKYTVTGDGSDSARVAKFGVKIETTGEMFGPTYKDEEVTVVGGEGDEEITVVSDVDVVAPGTNGTLAAYAVTGTPEVDVNVTYTAELTLGDKWKLANGDEYCPIVFHVNGEEIKFVDTVANLETAVETAIIEKAAAYYNAGTDLSTVNDDLTVTWAWAYESGNDDKDTYLGDQAAVDNAAEIALATSVTVTQAD